MEPTTAPVQRPDHVPEKFWNAEAGAVNTDALLASYSQLETKQSQAVTPATPVTPAPVAPAAPATGTPPVAPATAGLNVVPTAPAAPAATAFEITPQNCLSVEAQAVVGQEYDANNGVLSDATYATYAAAGVERQTVDTVIANHIQANVAKVDAFTSGVYTAAGTEADFNSMLTWAHGTLTPAEAEVFNAKMNHPSDAIGAQEAVKGLMARFRSEVSNPPANLVPSGGTPVIAGAVEGFSTPKEQTKAILDPRYNTDAAYTAQVIERIRLASF